MKRIGVLAVQGAFARHVSVLEALGHETVLVRRPEDLEAIDGLVLPGGESTVQLEMIDRLGLEAPIRAAHARGIPILATCAGVVLLAAMVTQPAQRSFALVDILVARNAWGRQVDSFEATSDGPFVTDDPLPLVFIRAPRILGVGRGTSVLATIDGEPILVREANVTCATFHPELTDDDRVHALVFGQYSRSRSTGVVTASPASSRARLSATTDTARST